MAKRLYLPRTYLSAISPSSWDATWHLTAGVTVNRAVMHPVGDTTAYLLRPKSVADNPTRILVAAWVTDPLAAGTIDGTLTWAVAHRASNNLSNDFPRIIVRLMSNDLTVERAVLATDQSASESGIAGEGVHIDLNPTLASTSITAGDRIVIEAGGSQAQTSADSSHYSHVWAGSPAYTYKKGDPANAAGDFQFTTEYVSATNRPWVEFSADLTFITYPPERLGRTGTDTTLTFTWDPSYQGDEPEGYEVRIDGGTAIDVGTDLFYEFTGLTESTHYLLEVRAYNDAGTTAWSVIHGDTWASDFEPPFDYRGTQVPYTGVVWKSTVALLGNGSLTLTASGVQTASPGGSGSLSLSGTGVGRGAPTGQANLTLTGTGAVRSPAAATGSLELSGSAAVAVPSAATASLSLSGTAAVTTGVTGTGSLSLTATGAASDGVEEATGTGSLELTGAAAVSAGPSGTAFLVLTGVNIPSPVDGTGSLALSATGVALASVTVTGTGSLQLAGTGTALVSQPVTGTGTLVLSAVGTVAEGPHISKVHRRASAFVGG